MLGLQPAKGKSEQKYFVITSTFQIVHSTNEHTHTHPPPEYHSLILSPLFLILGNMHVGFQAPRAVSALLHISEAAPLETVPSHGRKFASHSQVYFASPPKACPRFNLAL